MTAAGDAIMWEVVEEHLEEAAFLFEARALALDSPLYVLEDLISGPEERLLAHIDGLVVGGEQVATTLLAPSLEDADAEEPTRAAAAALALLAAPAAGWAQRLLEGLCNTPDTPRLGIVEALAIADAPELDARLRAFFPKASADVQRTLLPVLAARAIDPGRAMDDLLRDQDAVVRAHAAMAARYADRTRYLGWLEHLTADVESTVSLAAIESGLVLGSRAAWAAAIALATKTREASRDALVWVAMLGEAEAVPAIAKRLEADPPDANALFALGFSGRVEAAELCLAFVEHEEVGRVAAEAFVGITGLPRDEDEYWVEPPVPTPEDIQRSIESEPPPLEEDLAQDLVAKPDDDLPVPNPEAIRRWWADNRARFDARQRYIVGMPATTAALVRALRSEPLRRRHALATELACRTKGQAAVRSRSLGAAQRRQLEHAAGLPPIDANRPFSRIG